MSANRAGGGCDRPAVIEPWPTVCSDVNRGTGCARNGGALGAIVWLVHRTVGTEISLAIAGGFAELALDRTQRHV